MMMSNVDPEEYPLALDPGGTTAAATIASPPPKEQQWNNSNPSVAVPNTPQPPPPPSSVVIVNGPPSSPEEHHHNNHNNHMADSNISTITMASSTIPSTPTPEARMSNPWENDEQRNACTACYVPFTTTNRRHHCRRCGLLFCIKCSSHKALIPPSDICLSVGGSDGGGRGGQERGQRRGGNRGGGGGYGHGRNPQESGTEIIGPGNNASFAPDNDPNSLLSLINPSNNSLLYAKGLEERYRLAREPLRVCDTCYNTALFQVQEELRATNSNAMRFNSIDPTSLRRLFNSPLAFTLGHEVRKAAYTLNNLLPMPRRMGLLDDMRGNDGPNIANTTMEDCKDTCSTISPNMSNLDGVRIPARLLTLARGIAVMTVVKGGFGVGVEFGTGLVVARLTDGGGSGGGGRGGGYRDWSAPCAIGMGGISWGALVGAQVSDHVFLLMTDAAVDLLSSTDGSIHLGADAGVALGPIGRSVEGDVGVTGGAMAPIYTYSLSKGLYAGASFDGKVMFTRHNVNEKFYGYRVEPKDLLNGEVAIPPAAQPLYDALKRCHVYASRGIGGGSGSGGIGAICGPNHPPPPSARDYHHHHQMGGTAGGGGGGGGGVFQQRQDERYPSL